MSKVPHLLKGSALPDGEQRRLADYASAHPKSALHRKGQHHDAAVLLIHGIGYQNHGETLAYFGKPVADSVQTLLALNTGADSIAPENTPDAEASARVRVEVIPDGDTLPPAAEVNPLSHHSELTYSLTIERTEYPADSANPADPVEEAPELEESSAQPASLSDADGQNLLERALDSARRYRLRKWAVLRPVFDVSVLNLPVFEGAPAEELPAPEGAGFDFSSFDFPGIDFPKVELPRMELPKVELPKIDLPKIELPNIELPRLP